MHASSALLDPASGKEVKNMAQQNRGKVAGDMLSRVQVKVDAVLCCCVKDEFAEDNGPLYLWADSSPQHGVDWFLSTIMYIYEADVVAVMDAVHVLVRTVSEFKLASDSQDQDRADEIARERDAAGLYVLGHIHFHRQLPMAVGSGFTSVEHKLKCLIQKTIPEARSSHSSCNMFRRFRAACVDMGTELAIPDVAGLRVSDLAPAWMQPDLALQADAPQRSSPWVAGLPCEPTDFLMPFCMLSAGTCHIMNNMASRVHTS